MGFYLLFQDYQWESSDGGPGLTVELDNPELQRQIKALDSTVRYRFYDASDIMPAKVLDHCLFCLGSQRNPS